MDIKRILVPTDFSPAGRPAIEAACSFARRFGAMIDLLHVWELPVAIAPAMLLTPPVGPPLAAAEFIRGHAGQEMERLVGQLRAPGLEVRGRLESGHPAETILRIAESDGADLIVMGTHGRTGISHLLMGSVAERVVRRATCAVLTVRGRGAADAG